MKFIEVQKATIKYLESDEFKNREDAQTSIKIIPLLQKINSMGFITDDSQQGLISKGFNEITKNYYEIRERAYVTGFMKSVKAELLTKWINTYTDKVALIVFENNTKKEFNNFPPIPVTVQASNKNKIKLKEFKPCTQLRTVLPDETINGLKETIKLSKSENVEYIVIFDPVYGRHSKNKGGLYESVIKGLKAIK